MEGKDLGSEIYWRPPFKKPISALQLKNGGQKWRAKIWGPKFIGALHLKSPFCPPFKKWRAKMEGRTNGGRFFAFFYFVITYVVLGHLHQGRRP